MTGQNPHIYQSNLGSSFSINEDFDNIIKINIEIKYTNMVGNSI